jgi:hypothetical protein
MRSSDVIQALAQALSAAGRHELAARVEAGRLERGEASLLSYDFCRSGEGRLAALLASYAHPLPC